MTRARDVANLIGSGNFSSTTFTATAGQTAFTIAHTQGFVQVFMNGLLLDETADYTSNGTAITLTSGAAAGDEIEVVKYNTFSVGDAIPASGGTFTGSIDASAGLITPAGHVIQKVYNTWNTASTNSTTSFTDVTDSSLSFTPKLSTSRLFITAHYLFNPYSSAYYTGGMVRIVHDGTALDYISGTYETYTQQISSGSSANLYVRQSRAITVAAGSTNARTIKLQMAKYGSSTTAVRFNTDSTYYSTIIVEEIAQ